MPLTRSDGVVLDDALNRIDGIALYGVSDACPEAYDDCPDDRRNNSAEARRGRRPGA